MCAPVLVAPRARVAGPLTAAWTSFLPCVVHGRATISHSPSSSVKRSPGWSCIGNVPRIAGFSRCAAGTDFRTLLALTSSSARVGPRYRGGIFRPSILFHPE